MLHRSWLYISLFSVFVIIILLSRIRRQSTLIIASDEQHFIAVLNRILIPRWPGSSGHTRVREFLVKQLNQLGFTVFQDAITDPFPLTNVLGISNPLAERFLLLSCHYDTKYLESGEFFVSATDAGVSCALLLNMAKKLTALPDIDLLKRRDIGLVLAFFDGHDSAEGINDATYPLFGSQNFVDNKILPLESINVVITLNMIGAPNHIYMSKYERTYILHEMMANIEQKLRQSGQLIKCPQLFYKLKSHDTDMYDDHYPFLNASVPVMHVVPHTYPDVWLQDDDNIQNLHWPSVHNVNAILTRFIYEYIQGYDDSL
ncbi:glutaminyl-peptide cyclotransferase-like [Drosophila albomicans]|uniref:glutaminyl-peptide cyclotransferase n=1 Tax=Drosophila albomicans TaxID=7291 RepID=A0A6P8WP06_DROAB|nr:glutaminyl-peptide cyclotransferase-like [Drosophila albomicans]